jgi:hypothetical protein
VIPWDVEKRKRVVANGETSFVELPGKVNRNEETELGVSRESFADVEQVIPYTFISE